MYGFCENGDCLEEFFDDVFIFSCVFFGWLEILVVRFLEKEYINYLNF